MDDKKTKRQNVYKVIMLVILAVLITFMTTTLLMYKNLLMRMTQEQVLEKAQLQLQEAKKMPLL